MVEMRLKRISRRLGRLVREHVTRKTLSGFS
jgi:hypothetical protein